MSESHRPRAWRGLWIGLTETITFLPLPLVVIVYLLPETAGFVWLALLPLLFWAGERIAARMRKVRLYARLLIAAALGAASAVALLGIAGGAAAAALLGAAFAYRGFEPLDPTDSKQTLLLSTPGLLLYFAASVAAQFAPDLAPYRPLLAICGVVAILILVFRSNRITLMEANYSGRTDRSVPLSVIYRNRLMVTLFLLVVAAIVFFRYIEAAWQWVLARLREFFAWLASRETPNEAPPQGEPQGAPPMGLPPAEGEPSAFMQLLERIAIIAVQVAIAVALLYGLYLLAKRMPAIVRAVARWLARFREGREQEQGRGYEDDVESLFDLSEWNRQLGSRIRTLLRGGESWGKLSEQDKIRYLFRRRVSEARKKGFDYRPPLTPAENMAALESGRDGRASDDRELAALYEDVRYGGKAVTKEEADSWKRKLGL